MKKTNNCGGACCKWDEHVLISHGEGIGGEDHSSHRNLRDSIVESTLVMELHELTEVVRSILNRLLGTTIVTLFSEDKINKRIMCWSVNFPVQGLEDVAFHLEEQLFGVAMATSCPEEVDAWDLVLWFDKLGSQPKGRETEQLEMVLSHNSQRAVTVNDADNQVEGSCGQLES